MRKITKITNLEREAIVRDLALVGRTKAVGYLPLDTIERYLKIPPTKLAANARRKGLAALLFSSRQSCIRSGAFYVYHRAALRSLLASQADALRQSGLSNHPDQFVRQIASRWFGSEEPACGVIADAFAFTKVRRP
jgi:hypothetical protein